MGTEDFLSGLQRMMRDTDESSTSAIEDQEWLEPQPHNKYLVQFRQQCPSFTFSQRLQMKARSGTYEYFSIVSKLMSQQFSQTDKQQTEQSHAFYMILRRSNSEQNLTVSSPQIHFRKRINRSCRRKPAKLSKFSDSM